MTNPFFSSVTRIADLQDADFECRPLPRERWATGDYVQCEVVGRPGPLYQVELVTGRMCQVLSGDVVIGAFGKRAATLEGVGDWEQVGDDLMLHALIAAGLFGKATSVSTLLPELMRLCYQGHVVRHLKQAVTAQRHAFRSILTREQSKLLGDSPKQPWHSFMEPRRARHRRRFMHRSAR